MDVVLELARENPHDAWCALDALIRARPSPRNNVAAMLAYVGGDAVGKQAIDFFDMRMDSRWSNSRVGGRGSYRSWVRTFPRGSNIPRLIWFFESAGYKGLAPVMEAFDRAATAASVYQRVLLVLCMAWTLPWLRRSEAATCAAWFAELLRNEAPELRLCGVLCLQRLASGNAVPQVAGVAAVLGDDCVAVRRAAAVALGCLGRRAAPFRKDLARQLQDSSADVRFAALTTLGGLQALVEPCAGQIAALLRDPSPACRLAALRALQCAGATAAMYEAELREWEGLAGPGPRLAAIAKVALDNGDVPLKRVFRGRRFTLRTPQLQVLGGWALQRSVRANLHRIHVKLRKLTAMASH